MKKFFTFVLLLLVFSAAFSQTIEELKEENKILRNELEMYRNYENKESEDSLIVLLNKFILTKPDSEMEMPRRLLEILLLTPEVFSERYVAIKKVDDFIYCEISINFKSGGGYNYIFFITLLGEEIQEVNWDYLPPIR